MAYAANNEGADQRPISAFLFAYLHSEFSYDGVQLIPIQGFLLTPTSIIRDCVFCI